MNFTDSPYERLMKQPTRYKKPAPDNAPEGSLCAGCSYWRGLACVSCYRELLKRPDAGR